MLDGVIARKNNEITDLGKIFDPFSDCFMHLSFFACFTYLKLIPLWCFIIILERELLINFIRMLLCKVDIVLSANIFGKIKTVSYALLSFFVIAFLCLKVYNIFPENIDGILYTEPYSFFNIFACISAFFSVFSFVIYFKDVLKSGALRNISK